ncbi:hypothetical protein PX699_13870 [Sphingobium sp. H39-3-25]|uniref:hypothetical protein n=1 Tax=Sphingobium arseniciresistens TaxID=3030834 RepID=UPI0023B9FFC5|nr:hypothetical protein [Sphingobium arseniciresistens]
MPAPARSSLIAALLLAVPALAASPAAQARPVDAPVSVTTIAGHYYLEGVMETGSEMLLKPDGRFQWYLVYGALDLFAEGSWTLEDGKVVLTSRKSENAPEPPFQTAAFAVRDGRLIPPDERGAYVRAARRESPDPADADAD